MTGWLPEFYPQPPLFISDQTRGNDAARDRSISEKDNVGPVMLSHKVRKHFQSFHLQVSQQSWALTPSHQM